MDVGGRAGRGVVVAIDGGNSKTDVAVVTRAGTVLAAHRGRGVSHHVYGIRQSVLAIESMVRQALAESGLRLGPEDVAHVAAYLAGVDLPREQQEMKALLVAQGWSRTTVLDNDTFALLRLGAGSQGGVAVVCGAGINCVAVDQGGRTVRFPSLGQISGDWGGGEHLASEVMWAAARAEDGRGEPTMLEAAVRDHFATADVLHVIEAIHFQEIPAARLHELVPVLFDVADAGDPVAVGLVSRLADEIAALALVSLRRLRLLDAPTPVVLGGGVLAARHPLLVDGIGRQINAEAPSATCRYISEPPIAGAVLLGLDDVGATADPDVEAAVRAHYGDQMVGGS